MRFLFARSSIFRVLAFSVLSLLPSVAGAFEIKFEPGGSGSAWLGGDEIAVDARVLADAQRFVDYQRDAIDDLLTTVERAAARADVAYRQHAALQRLIDDTARLNGQRADRAWLDQLVARVLAQRSLKSPAIYDDTGSRHLRYVARSPRWCNGPRSKQPPSLPSVANARSRLA